MKSSTIYCRIVNKGRHQQLKLFFSALIKLKNCDKATVIDVMGKTPHATWYNRLLSLAFFSIDAHLLT